jgi:hypothetical protein
MTRRGWRGLDKTWSCEPGPQTAEGKATTHGNDERVSVEGVKQFVRYLRIAVAEVAASH